MSVHTFDERGWAGLWSSTLAVVWPGLNSRDVWEREYARGDWERIEAASEFGRNALVLAHVCSQGGRPNVLDVGCGVGRLRMMMEGVSHGDYVGIDLSSEAVELARTRNFEGASFDVAWAEKFETSRRFDVIVFNEVLYYMRSPEQVVEHYKRFLAPGGVIVISMFRCVFSRLIWRKLARTLSFTHQERVSNGRGLSWDVRVIGASH